MISPGGLVATLFKSTGAAVSAAVDSYFNQVSLLLQADGTTSTAPVYTNNTIVDSSYNSAVLARTGTPTQGTFSPFSNAGWSGYFNGINASLRLDGQTEFAFGSADFTIEMWVNITSVPAASTFLYDARPSGTAGGSYSVLMVSSTKEITYFAVGSARIVTPQALNTNQWYHVAVSRSAGVTTMYLDGVAQGTWNDATTYAVGAARPVFGISGNSTSTYFNGYISNARIVNGTAVYTSNFTPSAAPLTAVAGTSLLTLQDNRFKDNSANAFALTATGTPSVQATSPFPASAYSATTNGGSVYFNGTADFLSTSAINSSFAFGTGDFTVEAMVYPLASQQSAFISNNYNWSTGTGNWGFYTTVGAANTLYFNSSGGNRASTATVLIPLNQWTHITYSRQSGTGRFFVNGVQIGTGVADATNYASTTGTMYIGDKLGAGGKLNGYMSNVRVVKGTALYTATFAPPTAPLAITGNTALLLNGVGAGVIDATGKNDLVTVGNTKISTTQVKHNTGALYFSGAATTDYMTLPASQAWVFQGDHTLEAWVHPTAAGSDFMIFGTGGAGTNDQFAIFPGVGNARILWAYNANGNLYLTSTATIPLNTWTHVAVSRAGSTLKAFVNGTQVASITTSVTIGQAILARIGARSDSTMYFNGYIDDLRITKGIARYTADFTPPTQVLPNSSATDPYFNYNSLLLQGDVKTVTLPVGKNNVFIDSSSNALAITPTGTPTQGTFTPFSNTGWSGYFNGTSVISTPSMSAPSTVFTVEGWAYPTGFNASENLIDGMAVNGFQLGHNSTAFGIAAHSTAWLLTGATGLTLNAWNHFAVVRSGTGTNQTSIFVNGVRTANGTVSTTFATAHYNIGGSSASTYQFPGYLSNIRIVNGTAVYDPSQTTLTVPTTPLTAIAGTQLLTLQDNRFKDNSTNNFALTVTGTPSVQAVSPFAPTSSWSAATNGGSMYFNGTSDYLTTAANTVLVASTTTTPFTVEAWVYPTAFTGGAIITCLFSGAGPVPYSLNMGAVGNTSTSLGKVSFGWYNGSSWDGITSASTISVNSWTHIAAVFTGSTEQLYLNGVLSASGGATAIPIGGSNAVLIGRRWDLGGSDYFPGYISDPRVLIGTAVYTSAFTPPTAPLTPITNTSLLLSGTNIGVTDAASKADLKLVGGAQVNPNSKFGTGSLMLDGTTGYAQGTGNNINFSTGDFTIEAWIYPTTRPNPASIYAANASGTGTGAIFNLNAAGALRLGSFTTNFVTSTGTVPLNQWTHVAVTRSGTSLRLFINGVIDGTATNSTGFIDTNPILIGAYNGGGTVYFGGYIDDLRVTKGAARYTANFAVPTESFPKA